MLRTLIIYPGMLRTILWSTRRRFPAMASDESICRQVLVALRRIIRGIDLHSRVLIRDYGLTGPQLIVLEELARSKEVISVGQLAKSVNLSHATVTDILVRLEKRGVVQRTRSNSDKRRVLVQMTDLGLKILEKAPPLLQQRLTSEFVKLEDWEQTLILSSLQRIASMMEVRELEASPMLVSGPISAPVEESVEFQIEEDQHPMANKSEEP